MNESEILELHDAIRALGDRVRRGEQPTREIVALMQDVFNRVTNDGGVRKWHEACLDGLIRSLNWHAWLRQRDPSSVAGLTIALTHVARLADPLEVVVESLHEPADLVRVAALMIAIQQRAAAEHGS